MQKTVANRILLASTYVIFRLVPGTISNFGMAQDILVTWQNPNPKIRAEDVLPSLARARDGEAKKWRTCLFGSLSPSLDRCYWSISRVYIGIQRFWGKVARVKRKHRQLVLYGHRFMEYMNMGGEW
jgi:hypothetical protein